MEGKGLIEHIYIYETTTRQPADAYPHVIYCLTKWWVCQHQLATGAPTPHTHTDWKYTQAYDLGFSTWRKVTENDSNDAVARQCWMQHSYPLS